jgi:hypothetical protein
MSGLDVSVAESQMIFDGLPQVMLDLWPRKLSQGNLATFTDISVSRFGQAVVGASSVVWPCIAEWGWSRQRVIGLW